MIENLTIKWLQEKATSEEVYDATYMLIQRLNELKEKPDVKYFLGSIKDMGTMPKRPKIEDL